MKTFIPTKEEIEQFEQEQFKKYVDTKDYIYRCIKSYLVANNPSWNVNVNQLTKHDVNIILRELKEYGLIVELSKGNYIRCWTKEGWTKKEEDDKDATRFSYRVIGVLSFIFVILPLLIGIFNTYC